jgi:hypothetical protein
MTDQQRRQIVSRLNGRNLVVAFEAAKAIGEDTGRRFKAFDDPVDKQFERPLIATLKKGRRAFNRAAAAFAIEDIFAPQSTVVTSSQHSSSSAVIGCPLP